MPGISILNYLLAFLKTTKVKTFGEQAMKTTFWTAVFAVAVCLATASAQPRLAIGVTGGANIGSTTVDKVAPIVGVSTWFRSEKSLFLSSEYQWFKACDRFPDAPAGLALGPFVGRNSTQRLAIGVHYPLIENNSTVSLPGIYFGHSWSRCSYELSDVYAVPPYSSGILTNHSQRSAVFGSWTVLMGRGDFHFIFQARYGYSFSRLSSFSLIAPAVFGQLVVGANFGIF
jgi:hypothetical protein